jgi:hypothetical protein
LYTTTMDWNNTATNAVTSIDAQPNYFPVWVLIATTWYFAISTSHTPTTALSSSAFGGRIFSEILAYTFLVTTDSTTAATTWIRYVANYG